MGTTGHGAALFQLLTVLLVALKLGGVVGWPWWCVLAPLWLPAAIMLMLFAVFGLACSVAFVGEFMVQAIDDVVDVWSRYTRKEKP